MLVNVIPTDLAGMQPGLAQTSPPPNEGKSFKRHLSPPHLINEQMMK